MPWPAFAASVYFLSAPSNDEVRLDGDPGWRVPALDELLELHVSKSRSVFQNVISPW